MRGLDLRGPYAERRAPCSELMVPDEREPATPFLQMLSYMSAG